MLFVTNAKHYYLENTPIQQHVIQQDLHKLQDWSIKCMLSFNIKNAKKFILARINQSGFLPVKLVLIFS